MPNLISEIRTSKGRANPSNCNQNCYDSKREKCSCICGGINHGVGLKQAIINTRKLMSEKGSKSFRFNEKLILGKDSKVRTGKEILTEKYNKNRKKNKNSSVVGGKKESIIKPKTKAKQSAEGTKKTYQKVVFVETPETHDSLLFNKEKLEKIETPVIEEAIIEEAIIESPNETLFGKE